MLEWSSRRPGPRLSLPERRQPPRLLLLPRLPRLAWLPRLPRLPRPPRPHRLPRLQPWPARAWRHRARLCDAPAVRASSTHAEDHACVGCVWRGGRCRWGGGARARQRMPHNFHFSTTSPRNLATSSFTENFLCRPVQLYSDCLHATHIGRRHTVGAPPNDGSMSVSHATSLGLGAPRVRAGRPVRRSGAGNVSSNEGGVPRVGTRLKSHAPLGRGTAPQPHRGRNSRAVVVLAAGQCSLTPGRLGLHYAWSALGSSA
jgi:hypothetical protein